MIGVGGRFVPEVPPSKFNFAHYGFAGERDFNHREMRLVDEALEGRVPHRFRSFNGGHRDAKQLAADDEFAALRGEKRFRAGF